MAGHFTPASCGHLGFNYGPCASLDRPRGQLLISPIRSALALVFGADARNPARSPPARSATLSATGRELLAQKLDPIEQDQRQQARSIVEHAVAVHGPLGHLMNVAGQVHSPGVFAIAPL